MTVSVVIPTTRQSVDLLIDGLGDQLLPPDEILVVTNEIKPTVGGVTAIRFWSDRQPFGKGDAGLRRNIGASEATGEFLVFLDDDLLTPPGLIEAGVAIASRDGFCWGHHRYIDFAGFDLDHLRWSSPTIGRSREQGVNRWHGWQSSYAGLLVIRRDLFWEVGGFDLAFLGHHGSEDQQLGRRLSGGSYRTFVHEPPFAWHPEQALYHDVGFRSTNIGLSHRMERITVNGQPFAKCASCPCRYPLDIESLTLSEEVIIPFSRGDFRLTKEMI